MLLFILYKLIHIHTTSNQIKKKYFQSKWNDSIKKLSYFPLFFSPVYHSTTSFHYTNTHPSTHQLLSHSSYHHKLHSWFLFFSNFYVFSHKSLQLAIHFAIFRFFFTSKSIKINRTQFWWWFYFKENNNTNANKKKQSNFYTMCQYLQHHHHLHFISSYHNHTPSKPLYFFTLTTQTY